MSPEWEAILLSTFKIVHSQGLHGSVLLCISVPSKVKTDGFDFDSGIGT